MPQFGFWDPIIFVLGVGALVWAVRSWHRAFEIRQATQQVQDWVKTSGEIQTLKLGRRYRASGIDGESGVGVTIRYTYQVDGQRYEGDSLYAASEKLDGFVNEERAAMLQRHYHSGTLITVYYNPHQPGEAVLGLDWMKPYTVLEFVLGGGVFFLLGMWAMWRFFT